MEEEKKIPTIMIVDDEQGILNSLRRFFDLTRCARYILCRSAEEALQILKDTAKREEIHLILTDVLMPPGMSGVELAEFLHRQEEEEGWYIPLIVLMSGHLGEFEDRAQKLYNSKVVDSILAKPFPEVLKMIKHLAEMASAIMNNK